MRGWLALAAAVVVAAAVVYWLGFRDGSVTPTVASPRAAAVLGSGSDAVVVTSGGALVRWLPAAGLELPSLPDAEPPKEGRFRGPMLEQARVLGAVPDALRPHVERSYFGESGVDVILDSGIELRFGDATQAARKWRAAAAILADPTTVALDYVDLHAPSRPATQGTEHLLPAAP